MAEDFIYQQKNETQWAKTKFTNEEILKLAEQYPEDVGNLEMIEVEE